MRGAFSHHPAGGRGIAHRTAGVARVGQRHGADARLGRDRRRARHDGREWRLLDGRDDGGEFAPLPAGLGLVVPRARPLSWLEAIPAQESMVTPNTRKSLIFTFLPCSNF